MWSTRNKTLCCLVYDINVVVPGLKTIFFLYICEFDCMKRISIVLFKSSFLITAIIYVSINTVSKFDMKKSATRDEIGFPIPVLKESL